MHRISLWIRPAMLYVLETVALTKRQEAEMEVAELKMLRFSLGVTRMDKIRNEYIRGTAQVGREKTRHARLRQSAVVTPGGRSQKNKTETIRCGDPWWEKPEEQECVVWCQSFRFFIIVEFLLYESCTMIATIRMSIPVLQPPRLRELHNYITLQWKLALRSPH